MAIDNFIPEIWSARLLANLHNNLVFGQPGIINQDYEGDIQDAGDTVRINAIGAVTVGNYTKNSTSAMSVQTLQDAQAILQIDQAKYFAFQIDDVDRAQQKPKVMDAAMMEAAYALSNTMDGVIAALYSQIATANFYGSAAVPKTGYTAENIYEYLVELKVILDTNNVPVPGRFAVVPPFMHGYLLKDARFVKSGAGPDAATLANGEVGQAAGFRILLSNNVSAVAGTPPTAYKVIAGHPIAWTLAQQLRKIEVFRSPDAFADVVRGLHLYGAKVIRPNALACLVLNTS